MHSSQMRNPVLFLFLFLAILMIPIFVPTAVFGLMPAPSGQQNFSFSAPVSPLLGDDPGTAMPIGIGPAATGGDTLNIQIGLNQFSEAADIYFAVSMPTVSSELFMLTSSNKLATFSQVGLVPWKQNTIGSINESVFGQIPVSLLPPATYYLYLALTPPGTFERYYLWMTPFTVQSANDYSGTYYVTLSVQPQWMMYLNQSGNDITFSLDGPYLIEGEGTISNNTMNLTAELPQMSNTININAIFSAGGNSFSGTWEMGSGEHEGSITGTRDPWPIYDIDINGIPKFAVENVVELSKIAQISKFRSGIGHDYSDDFETCRNMKHYFVPKNHDERTSVKIFSPINGTIIATTEEWEEGTGWKGTNLGIQSDAYPALHVALMHIDLTASLDVGDKVTAGQFLGTPPGYENWTIADTVVGVTTPGGYRLISYFDVMTDALFLEYQARGMSSRDEAIITKEARDADPLPCEEGEHFEDSGSLENWIYLN